jgi:hypothetical protein
MIFRITDFKDLLRLWDLVLDTVTRDGRQRKVCDAPSTAAMLQVPAICTICNAVAIDRRLNGTG